LQQALAAQGMNLGDLAVNLHAPNRADASMTLNVRALNQQISVRPTASLHFGVAGGAITLVLDHISISGFNVPASLVSAQLGEVQRVAQNEINAQAKRMLANSGLRIIGVEATESALVIKLAR